MRCVPLAVSLLCLTIVGCGGTAYPHGTAKGLVTIDGQPVPKGAITFSPTTKGQGPITGAMITDGHYVCPNIPVGKLQVTFHAEAAEPRQMLDVSTGVMRQVPQDILPARYRSGLPAEIHTGTNELNFALTTSGTP